MKLLNFPPYKTKADNPGFDTNRSDLTVFYTLQKSESKVLKHASPVWIQKETRRCERSLSLRAFKTLRFKYEIQNTFNKIAPTGKKINPRQNEIRSNAKKVCRVDKTKKLCAYKFKKRFLCFHYFKRKIYNFLYRQAYFRYLKKIWSFTWF